MNWPSHRRDDDGFTLIELVVSIAILGIIVSVLAGVVIEYLKVTVATQERIGQSLDQQFVTAYWQRDVSSIGVREYDATTKTIQPQQSVGVAPACALTSPSGATLDPSAAVVTLAWSSYDADDDLTSDKKTSTLQTSTYIAQQHGDTYQLLRIRCNGAALMSSIVVANELAAPPAVECATDCTSASPPQTVTMKFTIGQPTQEVTLIGYRRQT